MSGHSKWSTIKRKKGAADAKRGAIFTRLSKDITLASKDGGSDIEMNPVLRLAVKKAKASNMPLANIEKAIKKGTGELPGIKYENYIYEGYGPSGVAILMEVMTDNKNRTVPDIRHIMSQTGGNLGEQGCVNWMFDKKGIFAIRTNNIDEDYLLELLDDIEIDDISIEDELYEITAQPENFQIISQKLEDSNTDFDGELSLVAQNLIQLSNNDANKVIKLLELIENHDDVQKVHTNFEII